jgi:hypothetical protein
METLLIRPSQITEFTPLGGNVDVDKYVPCIYDVQITVIEPLLGTELYEKVRDDFDAETLSGLYLTLYESYIKPILRHQVFAEYVEIGQYTVANGGIFKHTPTDATIVEKSEIQYLAQTQRSKAQLYIERARKWLCQNPLPEYNRCDTINVKVTSGWHLNSRLGDCEGANLI